MEPLKMQGTGGNLPTLSTALKHRMNYLVAREGIVSSNIANSSTPNYLSRDLEFSSLLKKAGIGLSTTHPFHIHGTKKAAVLGKETVSTAHIRDDGNSVKLDEEMLKLNDIQLNYRMATRLYAKHAAMQKMVLGGNR